MTLDRPYDVLVQQRIAEADHRVEGVQRRPSRAALECELLRDEMPQRGEVCLCGISLEPVQLRQEPDRSTQASECFIVRMLSATSCPDVCARIKAC